MDSFPKNQRFVFGQRIGRPHADLLARANRDIEVLRWPVRMATDRELLTPRQYKHCCMSPNECVRMVGGWCKQASSRKRDDNAPGEGSV